MGMGIEIGSEKFQFLITFILVLFVSVTGFTYAYFAIDATNSNTIMGTAATVNLTLEVERKFPLANSTNTGVLVPQLSTITNSPLAGALKNGCVDDNGNVICHVYEISIANIGGTATQVVDGSVSFYGNVNMTSDAGVEMPNLRWKLINSIDEAQPSNSVLGTATDLVANFNKNIFADDLVLGTNDSEVYYMIIWINETTEDQPLDEGKSFYGKVEFNSSNGTGVTSTFTA